MNDIENSDNAETGVLRIPDERRRRFALFGVLVIFFCLLCWDLTEPWIGHHDYNGAWISCAARNHIEQGFLTTKFGVLWNYDPGASKDDFEYYNHHPPLVPLIVACFFSIFGESEWAARLVPILTALGSAYLLFVITSIIANRDVALLSVTFYVLMPMNTYFGRMLNHEVPTLFFSFCAILWYLRWRKTYSLRAFLVSLLFLILGMLCGWPAYYLGGFLPLHYLLTKSRDNSVQFKIFILPVICIICFAVHLIHTYLLVGFDGFDDIKNVLQLRTTGRKFSWLNLMLREIDRGADLFTLPLLVLSGLSLYNLARKKMAHLVSDPILLVLLGVFGVTHIVLFSHGAWVHDYWAFYCAPAIAIFAAAFTLSLGTSGSKKQILIFLILLVSCSAFRPLRSLHRNDYPILHNLGLLLKDRVNQGTEIVWNLRLAWWPWPQTGFYARRDMYPHVVRRVVDLEKIIADTPITKDRAFVFHRYYGEESEELKNWLDSRYEYEEFDYSGRHYFIYTIPGNFKDKP